MGARKMPNAGRDVGVGGRARSLREGIRQQHVRLVRILGRGIQRYHVRAGSVFDAMRAARRSECDTNSRSLRDHRATLTGLGRDFLWGFYHCGLERVSTAPHAPVPHTRPPWRRGR